MPDSLPFFSNYITEANKRYYLFLQIWPLIFPINCKLGERGPGAAVLRGAAGSAAEWGTES